MWDVYLPSGQPTGCIGAILEALLCSERYPVISTCKHRQKRSLAATDVIMVNSMYFISERMDNCIGRQVIKCVLEPRESQRVSFGVQ